MSALCRALWSGCRPAQACAAAQGLGRRRRACLTGWQAPSWGVPAAPRPVLAPRCSSTASSSSTSLAVADLEGTLGKLSRAPLLPPAPPLVVVISGPSGVGKDAVIKRLQKRRPDLYFVVTATSRSMRPGEQHGVDYFFVSKQQFEEWVAREQLLEHAIVYGEYKGIPRSQVEEALARGTDVVLRIDVQGAETVRRLLPGVVSIFLVAESEAALVERLVARKTESPEAMVVRAQTARAEMAHASRFDYVVVNQDGMLEATVTQLEAILQAEKCRVARRLGGGDGCES